MGCDIHGFIEYKKTVSGKTEWRSGDYFKKNEYFGEDDEPEFKVVEAFGNRNYFAFAQLCGVRSRGKDIEPISEPKGLPDDVTNYVKSESERWGCDGHSHSFVTLRQVIDYRKNLKPTKVTGMISEDDAKKLSYGIIPESWCQWTNQSGFVEKTWEDKVDALYNLESVMRSRAKEFLRCFNDDQILEQADNIRFVFWFDN